MGSNEYIWSPVLYFLHDKVGVLKNDDMLTITSYSYNEDEIKAVKNTLDRVTDCEADCVDCKDGDTSKKNITDISRKPYNAPRLQVNCCVTNNRGLPLVYVDHVAVAALVKSNMEIIT